jgi:hypothetical protein
LELINNNYGQVGEVASRMPQKEDSEEELDLDPIDLLTSKTRSRDVVYIQKWHRKKRKWQLLSVRMMLSLQARVKLRQG